MRPAYSNPLASLSFNLSSPEVIALMSTDDDMRGLIEAVGEVDIDIEADGFIALARAICDQQISIHAARAIWGRLETLCGGVVAPETILALDIEMMRGCGLSRSKAAYITDLATRVSDGRLILESLHALGDQEVIERLVTVKGIGVWTAQMHLIFALSRLDVFAPADGGLRRSLCALKGLPSDVPIPVIEEIAQEWAPYRTVASLYLWRGLGQGVVQAL